jgi:dolichol-phosphate mannosyltransferase
MLRIDIVVPVFNEGALLPVFHDSLKNALAFLEAGAVRYIYVNDGSTDATQEILTSLSASDRAIAVIELSRNFGHQAALSAGLWHADADIVIMMDGDGQHPPALLPRMLELHDSGYDVVQGQRLDHGASLKRATSRTFYWLISRVGSLSLAEGASDFRSISRRVLLALREVPEYHRFYRGIIPWLGFRTSLLPYQPGERLAGSSKYSLRKMLRLAADGVFSFSLIPLKLGIVLGSVFLCLAATEVVYVGSLWFSGKRTLLVPGWSSLIVITTAGLGAMMVLLGFIGVYVGMIFQEVKRRPVYVVRSVMEGGVEAPRHDLPGSARAGAA